jgi:hypothetical protein
MLNVRALQTEASIIRRDAAVYTPFALCSMGINFVLIIIKLAVGLRKSKVSALGG